MTKILCFGNEFVKEDSLAKEIADELNIDNVEFVKCSSIDDLYDHKNEEELFIMDVVKGIDKVIVINDIDKLKQFKACSCHDFDLAFYLKLLTEIGQLKKVNIIGIPAEGNKEEIKEELAEMLKF
ncbi:hypothetical protein KY339_01785 [Candidatus Woesearchaeota archaeon]|nr:hypothetical protein [Candidatus Woesearchaeota archaeon]